MRKAITGMKAAAFACVVVTMAAGPAVAADAGRTEVASLDGLAPAATCLDVGAVDALTLSSDFSLFMRRDCPEALRQEALRHLWTLMPSAPVPTGDAI